MEAVSGGNGTRGKIPRGDSPGGISPRGRVGASADHLFLSTKVNYGI